MVNERTKVNYNKYVDKKGFIWNYTPKQRKLWDWRSLFYWWKPFLQASGLAEVAQWAHCEGLSIFVFTDYLLDELKEMHNADVDLLLKYTDILMDGSYIQEQYDNERDWIVSKNQRVFFWVMLTREVLSIKIINIKWKY